MTGVWVDTDFGFDDLWALLLLRQLGCTVSGVSLVAGNAPLAQVSANAAAAKEYYGFDWPIWKGASQPLEREPETAVRVLGPTGMRTRGNRLPPISIDDVPRGAVDAICRWLQSNTTEPKEILALGPLTNIARLVETAPDLAHKITRIVWMGASTGAGNHTALAEFNALADAKALEDVLASGIAIDIVDLMFCRSVTISEDDVAVFDPVTRDLLGGYLDIALERGRPLMAIYDPLAAIAIAQPEYISFKACTVAVSTRPDETHGATMFSTSNSSNVRVAAAANRDLSAICLEAFYEVPENV